MPRVKAIFWKTTAMPCSGCGGRGFVYGMDGPTECDDCRGDGQVRARDERGRFTPARIICRDVRDATTGVCP